jgi:Protein of unknown function (DUF2795)
MAGVNVAELQALLEGVDLPATPRELRGYAVREGAGLEAVRLLEGLTQPEYESLDDVAEDLQAVQPRAPETLPPDPEAESGAPPGGKAYERRD